MRNILLKRSNKRQLIFFIGLLSLFFFISVLIPVWFINYFSLSGIGFFFKQNIFWIFISLGVVLYFIISGVYYYKIKIDFYIIHFISYSVFSNFFRSQDYVDINHEMLLEYSFFNRSFSFNKTLMLKLMNDNGRVITKRFNITFLSENDISKISKALDSIIEKNK